MLEVPDIDIDFSSISGANDLRGLPLPILSCLDTSKPVFGFRFVFYLVKNVDFNDEYLCKKFTCFGHLGYVGGP